MAHRSQTQYARADLPMPFAQPGQLAPSAPAPARQDQSSDPCLDPEAADRWLHWLKICLGCETG